MDVESLAKQLILQNMTPEQQTAVLDSIRASVMQAKDVQKQRIGENVQVVVQALKKLEADIKARYDETGKAIEKRVASIKDGQDGRNGTDGKAGKDGRPGRDGATGPKGADGLNGRDGIDGENGVSVTDAHIDFDGSLVISLSSGRTINVGEVVAPDLAEKIKVITNGGGTSQTVIDTLASLQTQINNLIPSQTGNSGKFLTTNGSVLSWAQVAGGLSYQGTWNATTNTPTLTSGTGSSGYYYIVATAGSTNLDGITDWQVGDWLMFNGTVWQKIDQSNLVTSVNGQTGAVSLSTTNISEGTNLYYTDARARASVSAGTGINYSSATGVITNAAPDQTVALTAGTGISTTGTYPNFTIANTAPDQTVALTQGGTTTITGTYPNFTISSADQYVGTVTGVTATSPVVSSGGTAPAISLASGYGDTLNPYASKTANFVLAAPNGTAGAPTFRAVVAADIPTLNQNTTGNAATATTATNQSGGTVSATSIAYSTTLTGGTGIINIGSGQVYKDASGNVGIGTSSPNYKFNVGPTSGVLSLAGAGISLFTSGSLTSSIGGVLNFRPNLGTTASDIFNLSICAYDHSGDTNADGLSINGSDGVSFSTGGNSRNERARIDSSGNLLLGRTTQNGSEKFGVSVTNSGVFAHWRSTGTSGNPNVFRLSTGQLSGAIGTGRFITCDDGGSDKFFVAGSGVVNSTSTSITSISDSRLKENVRDLETGLASVMALKPRRFDWKENQGTNKKDVAGFIAQEVETVLPDLIGEWKNSETDEATYKSLAMGDMIPTLVKAIQEQQALIITLTARITALETA